MSSGRGESHGMAASLRSRIARSAARLCVASAASSAITTRHDSSASGLSSRTGSVSLTSTMA